MSDNSGNKNASSNKESSTLGSYVDSATGAIQDFVGKMTGGAENQEQGQERQPKAQQEAHDPKTAKVPGATLSSSGAVAKDDPNRAQGSWDQTIGSAKEAIGGLVGNESLKQAGREQNLEGQQKEAKGQLGDYGSGLGQRAQGAVGEAVSGLTGDKEGQAHYSKMREEGRTLQRGAEHDIHKQAEGREGRS
ncbi:hypothetical protein ESCO_004980 [Escovopsis weberi]|uniref:CsbD-like domain-containing protein n=1 Tax=Escovopsis weberi TaxID=150374 RepID=A0A0M8N6H2_ESCWE|nr:hypothetical protein ESCO_004980 [Escovopsis weberi]